MRRATDLDQPRRIAPGDLQRSSERAPTSNCRKCSPATNGEVSCEASVNTGVAQCAASMNRNHSK